MHDAGPKCTKLIEWKGAIEGERAETCCRRNVPKVRWWGLSEWNTYNAIENLEFWWFWYCQTTTCVFFSFFSLLALRRLRFDSVAYISINIPLRNFHQRHSRRCGYGYGEFRVHLLLWCVGDVRLCVMLQTWFLVHSPIPLRNNTKIMLFEQSE